MARNGAMLPKVDLETGVSDGEMTAVRRTLDFARSQWVIGPVAVVGFFIYQGSVFATNHDWPGWPLMWGILIFGRVLRAALKEGPTTIWEFREAAGERRRQYRRKWRVGLLFVAFAMLIGGAMLSAGSNSLDTGLLFCGFGLLAIQSIWAFFDRPKTRSESAPRGWLRIRNIHPEAMARLRRIEAEELGKISLSEIPRRRRVFTAYYHRYPLRSLLGDRWKNPFAVFVIARMKFLRSKRLERESYEFTEAQEISEEQAHERLRERIQSWRAAHPDWPVLYIERLPSPAGDLTLESAFLASPDLAHFLCFHHSWLEQRPPGSGEFHFITWLAGEKMLCTTHKPLLPIDRQNVETLRVKGTEEEVFQAHLQRCALRQIDAAADHTQVRERFQQEKKQMAELLEKAGLRGPSFEIG